jgi:hypothetical protein
MTFVRGLVYLPLNRRLHGWPRLLIDIHRDGLLSWMCVAPRKRLLPKSQEKYHWLDHVDSAQLQKNAQKKEGEITRPL